MTPTLQGLFEAGVRHHQMGQLAEAERLYRQVLAADGTHADALHLLGTLAHQVGHDGMALELIGRAIGIDGKIAPYHASLGNVLQRLGRLDEAVAAYDAAIHLDPDHAAAHSNRGTALKYLGRLEDAVAAYRTAIRLKPDYVAAHANLGNALKELQRFDEAVASYGAAIRRKPDHAQAHSNMGVALHQLGRLDDAVASYRAAIRHKPDYADAHANLGLALQDLRRFDAAVAAHRTAVAIEPDYAPAHAGLGGALKELGRHDGAVASYTIAIRLRPDLADLHSDLGNLFKELGHPDRARACFAQARICDPSSFPHAVSAGLTLPIIAPSVEEIERWRRRYESAIEELSGQDGALDDIGGVNPASFYLAYHGKDNRPIMEALCRLFRAKAAMLTDEGTRPPSGNRRIRVGFISEYLVGHTIGKLYQGFLAQLDRARFEVILIHSPRTRHDEFSARLRDIVDKTLCLEGSLEKQRRILAEECLDVLFYADVGMNPATYFLSFSRLAPVQATSWGHPDTTGLDTIDYFLSSELIEPPEAETYYSERLIRLPHLPCFYQPVSVPAEIPSRTDLGLPERGTLYGCPQSLFKLHPDFDAILADIAAGDPQGHIVFLQAFPDSWTELVRDRWRKSHPILLERAIFLPRQPLDRFMALMAHFDLLLDPIHFGSGNTLYEAMVYGTPIVTWPGQFMRARIVAGAYRQMGLANPPIAERVEDYAPLALALGKDADRRENLRRDLLRAAGELLSDVRAVRELEDFLLAAVAAAGRGEKLPAGWKPI